MQCPPEPAHQQPRDLARRNDNAIAKVAGLCPTNLAEAKFATSPAPSGLDKIAIDFAEHCATRREAGKSILIRIDNITYARMHQRIVPRWKSKPAHVRAACESKSA